MKFFKVIPEKNVESTRMSQLEKRSKNLYIVYYVTRKEIEESVYLMSVVLTELLEKMIKTEDSTKTESKVKKKRSNVHYKKMKTRTDH